MRCVNCGGPLQNIDKQGESVECNYCHAINGNQKDDINAKMKQAIEYRENYDFDSALELYNDILNIEPKNTQAIWGRLCCKYGVAFIMDEKGNGSLTCLKFVDGDFTEEPDYKETRASLNQDQDVFIRENAKKIKQIQDQIRLYDEDDSKKYDIFICYKETMLGDKSGTQTEDSFDAELMYYHLKEKGYRVFFSKKILKNKGGINYEAAIFTAIAHAKVMIVYGSDKDYFNSSWVKSEWQRYLYYHNSDANSMTRLIIPVIKTRKVQLPSTLKTKEWIVFEEDEKKNFKDLKKSIDDHFDKPYVFKSGHEEHNQRCNMEDDLKAELFRIAGKYRNDDEIDYEQLFFNEDDFNTVIGKLERSSSGAVYFLLGCIYYERKEYGNAKYYFDMASKKGIDEAAEQLKFIEKYEDIIDTK